YHSRSLERVKTTEGTETVDESQGWGGPVPVLKKGLRRAFSATLARRRLTPAGRRPAKSCHVDAVIFDPNALRFEQAPLERPVRFGDAKSTSSTGHAVPWDATAARASGHGVADGSRPTAQAERPRQLAISRDLAARNFLDQAVNRVPGHEFSW